MLLARELVEWKTDKRMERKGATANEIKRRGIIRSLGHRRQRYRFAATNLNRSHVQLAAFPAPSAISKLNEI